VDPVVAIDKALVGAPVRQADGSWVVSYDVVVSNRVAPNRYDLEDRLVFGGGIEVVGAVVSNTGPGGIETRESWDGVGDLRIVSGEAIGAGVSHTYRVEATALVPASAGVRETDCSLGDGEVGTGFLNRARVSTENQDLSDEACAAASNVSIEKALVGELVVEDDNSVTSTYAVSVSNAGAGGDVYDLDDALLFGEGISVNSASVANLVPGDVVVDPAWDGLAEQRVASGVEIGGSSGEPVVHTYVVTVNATVGSQTSIGDADCALVGDEAGTGFLNRATLIIDEYMASDRACGEVDPVVAIDKALVGAPVRQADGSWVVSYDVVVSNRVAPNRYDLEDRLVFGGGIEVVGAVVSNTGPGGIETRESWDGVGDLRIVSGEAIGAGVSHTYRVEATALVPASAGVRETDCSLGDGEVGTGFLNRARVSTENQDLSDEACAAASNVSIEKALVGELVVEDDNSVTSTYAVSVSNAGAGGDVYDLDDALLFGEGISVNSASVANLVPGDVVVDPAWDGLAEQRVASGVEIGGSSGEPVVHTYVVTVNATVGSQTSIGDADCALVGDEAGTGFLNRATLIIDEYMASDRACGEVDPVVAIDKALVGAPAANGDGTWTITYDITATNVGPIPGAYDLEDQLMYGEGVSVVAAEVRSYEPTGIATNPGWDGISDTLVTEGVALPVAGVHTYRATVEAAVAANVGTGASNCSLEPGESGTGFMNQAQVRFRGGSAQDAACGEIPVIEVVKTLDGEPRVTDDGNVDVSYTLTVRNTGSATGNYTLRDELRWGAGLTVTGAQVDRVPDGHAAAPGWNGVTQTLLADGIDLEAGGSHAWRVRVTGSRTSTLTSGSGDCDLGAGENGTGLLNTATVESNGQQAESSACSPVSPVEEISADDAGPRPGNLPRTGAQLLGLALTGLALVVGGMVLLGGGQRRRRSGAA
jgi:hypothetical protein